MSNSYLRTVVSLLAVLSLVSLLSACQEEPEFDPTPSQECMFLGSPCDRVDQCDSFCGETCPGAGSSVNENYIGDKIMCDCVCQ